MRPSSQALEHGNGGGEPTAPELLALLDALPASVAFWDADVRLRYGNQRALDRFGRPADQLLGIHLSQLVQPQAVELSAAYIEGALAGRVQQVERAKVGADGQRFNAHQVTHIPNFVGGQVTGYCALAVDITASIEGYEQARRAREQAALEAERARIAGDIGSHNVIDELGDALERLDAAVGRASEVSPTMRAAAGAIERAIAELRATVPARMRDDRSGDWRLVAFPHPSSELDLGRTLGVRWPAKVHGAGWTAADATAALDLIPAAVAAWDPSLQCVFANRAALRWFGVAERIDARGRPARELLGPGLFETANKAYAEAALSGRAQQFDRSVPHASGLRHLQIYCGPREGGGLFSFVVDVTDRVEAELVLQDARAELAQTRERQRIADELHNMVIQRLFAAGLAATRPSPRPNEQQLHSVQDGIMLALDEMEAALSALHDRPPSLDLLPDLARLVHAVLDPRNIEVTIENVGSLEYVPPAFGAELLSAAEAVLSQVIARAGVHKVVVTVAADTAGLWLRITDDGRLTAAGTAGVGLDDVARAAERLGGSCLFGWRQGVGTVVDWRVPFV
ncbi:MAG: PAS domain-containing protein [Jatrophihabitans sp.]|uniref:PAS domain-containing protein n=1 Tax=Jatrophihabitans sp. TaxID=1932789 RepID=UPI003F7F14A3